MIGVGSRVKLRNRETGIVVELKNSFARVITENLDAWYPIDELEEELTLIDRFLKGDFDDGLDFILAMDAYRLLTEYKFNPYVLASSTKIRIFPHQIDEVTHILDRSRVMVADEVGLGKTITAALVASELKARGLAKKLLFVVPKALVFKWKYELEQRFELMADILDSNYVRLNPEPFNKDEFCYVSSMDYLKQDHVLKLLDNANFDVVVVDEAHKFALGTERLELGRHLAEKSNCMLFLTATPHNGDDEDYLERMKLLDPYVMDVKSATHILIRNMKEDVVDLDGKEVFPGRKSETCPITLTHEELKIHRMVDEYIAKRLEDARDRKEYNAVKFLGNILRKRASSSLKALRLTLERRLEKLGEAVEPERAIRRMREAEEEHDEEQYEESEESIIGLTASKVETEKNEIIQLLEEIDKLDGKDSKLDYLLNFMIKTIKKGDPKAKIVVFSEYRDTVDYLFEKLSKSYKVEKIYGIMSLEERQKALDVFRDPEGAEIMVCTDAAGEGIDMQFANIEINYDLPWNPNRLEQRMGRIHRIGQTKPVYYYNFVLSGTIDGYILSKVLDKIEAIKGAMGDKVYDVIGKLLSEEDISNLYNELLKAPREVWEAKVKRIDGIIEEKRRILQEINSLLSGYRLDRSKLEDMKKVRLQAVDKGEVRRFIEVYLNHKGGKIELIKSEEELYRIFLPRPLAHKIHGSAIFSGSFSSEIAQQKNYPYLALGNRQVMEMIKDATKPCVSIFTHHSVKGLLYLYRLTIKDGRKQERDGKLIALLYDGGKVVEVDPRFVWDLEPVYDYQPEMEIAELKNGKSLTENEAYKMLQQLKEDCDKRLSEIKKKTRDIMITYFSKKMRECEEKIKLYEQRLTESPHYSRLITREKNIQKRLKEEMLSKLEQLNTEFETIGFYEPIGLALIVQQEEGDARKKVEEAGMKAVIEYEKKRAEDDKEKLNKIRDVSDSLKGYDVESFDRVIEVKSFSETGPIELTSHEWETAQRMKDYYWLYIVENALEQPKITTICNPVEKFKDKVKKIPFTDYRYIVEKWKD